MKTLNLHRISFEEGIEFLQSGVKITDKPNGYRIVYKTGEEPRNYFPKLTFFEDGSVMGCVSDWSTDYYGDIEPKDPLFFFGRFL